VLSGHLQIRVATCEFAVRLGRSRRSAARRWTGSAGVCGLGPSWPPDGTGGWFGGFVGGAGRRCRTSSRSTMRVRGVSGLCVGHLCPGRCSTRGVDRGGFSRISILGRSATRRRWARARS
jgi:hypothetical protein